MRVLTLTVLMAIAAAGCATDPRDVIVTEQNKDSFMEEIKNSEGLTVEEVGLLAAHQMRRAAAKSFGGNEPTVVGKTIGQIIDDERKLQAEAKAKADEAARLAAEAKAKADAAQAEMRNALTFTVYEKGFVESDFMSGRVDDLITIRCAYENKTDKEIRAFRGAVRFTDLFDKEIFETNITIQDPLGPREKATWAGQIRYNQFLGNHQNLRSTDLKDMKIVWLPDSILFADGTQMKATEDQ